VKQNARPARHDVAIEPKIPVRGNDSRRPMLSSRIIVCVILFGKDLMRAMESLWMDVSGQGDVILPALDAPSSEPRDMHK
jgi:hypothetical protein